MKQFLFLTLGWICLGLSSLSAQVAIEWRQLADVRFDKPTSGTFGYLAGEAHFGDSAQKLSGQLVSIQGYMLPLTADNKEYILSQYSFDQCFFCGGAGKETVILLRPQEQFEFELDEVVRVEGRLSLHSSADSLAYILREVREVK